MIHAKQEYDVMERRNRCYPQTRATPAAGEGACTQMGRAVSRPCV
ncbi:hypothetical protein ACFOLG_16865 [Vogesella facilis]|uniref:Uncharacterized protein n=1 Tax=Vogesella facilis TaxID=1655232 RepID=A0ABV7RHT0_9NEIS